MTDEVYTSEGGDRRTVICKLPPKYILDFYCPKAKLAIELDGGQHYEEAGLTKDQERTRILNQHSIHVLRYTNIEVLQHFEGVCAEIDEWVLRRVQVAPARPPKAATLPR